MKHWKRFRAVLAVILVAVMLVQMTIVAFAEPTSQNDSVITEPVVTEPVIENESEQEAQIIAELTDERQEYEKRFMLSNGSMMAVQYDLPVHYLDDDGNWIQYNNRMQETDSILDTEVERVSSTEYRVIESDSDVRLSKKAGDKKIVTIAKDGHQISWGFVGVNKVELELTDVDETTEGNDKFLNLQGIVQEGWYRDAFENADLQYLILPTGVKENIILKSADAPTEFELEYKFKKLNAVQIDSKTIDLQDSEGNVVYTITAPNMQDANGAWSDALSLSITEQKNNKLRIKLTIDEDWINSTDRAFPITVDPTFDTEYEWGIADSATLASGHPDTSYGNGGSFYIGTMYVGYEPESGFNKTRSLFKLNALPELSPGDVVVGAKLCAKQYASSMSIQVNAYEVNSEWEENTATWANMHDKHENEILDYEVTTFGSEEIINSWDITPLVREWYNGTSNYGIMLVSPSEDATISARVAYFSSAYVGDTTVYPFFEITYRNNKGLEEYWTYHQQTLMNGSVGYINDYSGNLVYQVPVMSETGSRMPISVSLVYNGYTSNQHIFGLGLAGAMGKGWQTDWNQYCFSVDQVELDDAVVASLKDNGYIYVYIDGDGTVHYFKETEEDSNVLEDEDGLGMTMKVGSMLRTIECSDGTVLHFAISGALQKIVDSKGESATATLNVMRIDKITDGVGRETTFSYTGSLLTKVTDPKGRVTTFTYDENENLTKVTYADGTSVSFTYSPTIINGISYSLIDKVTDSDGTYLDYDYVDDGEDSQKAKVSSVKEYGSSNTLGNTMTITYSNDNTTAFTYTCGSKETGEMYQFDDRGRSVCLRNNDGSFSQVGYTSSTGKDANRLTQASAGEGYINNLLLDSSVEKGNSDWKVSGSTTNLSIDSTNYFLGYKSLKVSRSTSNTDKQGYYQTVQVSGGKPYTFSAYVKTDNVIASGTNGAGLYVKFYNSNGTELSSNVSSLGVVGTRDWHRINVSFTAPSGAVTARVYCGLMSATGTAYFDCMQFENGNTMNTYNMLESSSFEHFGSWYGSSLADGDGTDTTNKWFKITGSPTANRSAYQVVPINRAKTSFTLSAVATGDSVPVGYDDRYFALHLEVMYSDGTSARQNISFNTATSAQQKASFTFMMDEYKQGVVIDYVIYYLIYYKNANEVYFSECMLTFDELGTVYSYNDDGDLEKTLDNSGHSSEYIYDDEGNLTNIVDENGDGYDLRYDSDGQITSVESTNPSESGSSVKYDSYGNVTDSLIGTLDSNGNVIESDLHIKTSSGYNSTGNYQTSSTDEMGNTTTYTVDDATGVITAVTNPLGNTVNYNYDEQLLNLESITSESSSVGFEYDNANRLSSILHNQFNYNFTYDEFGNVTSVKVGNQALVTNAYENGNGYLSSMTYGNGTKYSYTYDDYGRVTSIAVNDVPRYILVYDANGNLAYTYTVSGNTKQEYTYDNSGNVVRIQQPGYSDIRMNALSDLQSQTVYSFGGQEKILTLTQSEDGLNSTSTLISGLTAQKKYDSFNREEAYLIGILTRNISYRSAGENRTTNIPSSLSYKVDDNTLLNVSYTYDDVGNILTMTLGDVTYNYTYDSLNQLIRVTDGTNVETYTYDNAGNITSKTINGVTYDYVYGNSDWKDLLTEYDGDSITYDAIGNPLAYRDGMSFTWIGRQMNTVTVNGATTRYTYDMDGIRTKKVVNGVTTEYFLNGTTILAEKTGNDIIWYIYDADGEILGLIYNGASYYYLKNQQGDVISIVDENMNVVNSYTYDAWGKVTAITGNGTIGAINPIRYRGYYYDNETGLYYLNSRYYDPEIGRFVNADEPEVLYLLNSVSGANLFAYCNNNPTINFDPTGYFTITRWMISVPIDALLIAFVGGVFAPIKALAKKLGPSALKSALKTPLAKFITAAAKYIGKALNAIKNVVSKVPFIGKWLAKKLPSASKLGNTLAGGALSGTINKILNVIVPNITIFLSVGGMVSGLLDILIDGKLNNKIWTF